MSHFVIFWKRAEGKHLAAVMSQFRVDKIGHAKIISVNLCVAANCALILPRGVRLQLLRHGCVFESLKVF